jgi:ATP-binding cassette, subfamily A (ABC1), member 3
LQNIEYYAKIKGIPSQLCKGQILDILSRLDLLKHKDKAMTNLSGGMQRKLSVAVALLGNPPIILLDEPSAGMDPEARQFLRSVV